MVLAYDTITELVDDRNTTIARLRKLLFGSQTEKTKAVVGGKDSNTCLPGGSSASPPATVEAEAKTVSNAADAEHAAASKGHGRNGADAYGGAEKVRVMHDLLQPGDPCPKCARGTV